MGYASFVRTAIWSIAKKLSLLTLQGLGIRGLGVRRLEKNGGHKNEKTNEGTPRRV